ncbi:MAG: hypothetical protein J6U16_08485 [Ruminococcus sp.]|nr:hypothetical protein [Ruminococcus sp.]
MKKSAIIAVLSFALLTGCGKTDPVVSDPETAETTVAVEKKTEKTTDASVAATDLAASTTATTTVSSTKSSANTTTTSAKTIAHGGTTLTVAKRTNTSVKATTKHTSVTTAQDTTTTTAVSTTTAVANNKVFTKDKLECIVTSEGIDVSVDNEKLQTIEIDTEELINALSDIKTEMKASIIIEDVDLDGKDDLFIPQQVGTLNTFGVYYHFDSVEEKFVKWEELSEIDSRADVNEEDRTFITTIKLSEDEYEEKLFAWNGSTPEIQTMKKKYRSAEDKNEILIDYFEYTIDEELLVKRERVLFDADGREAGAEEVELG